VTAATIEIIEAGAVLLRMGYATVLAPVFPEDELVSLAELESAIAANRARAYCAVSDGQPVGVAVFESYVRGRVALVGYLAVDGSCRDAGIGGSLLEAARRHWMSEFPAELLLVEIEDPRAHETDEVRGDPARRVAFYERFDAAAIEIPYFQPALRRGAARVYGMLLAALPVADGKAPPAVSAELLGAFLGEYFDVAEGADRAGDQARAELWRAVGRSAQVTTTALSRLESIPRSLQSRPAAAC
jgi:hypothetical protein